MELEELDRLLRGGWRPVLSRDPTSKEEEAVGDWESRARPEILVALNLMQRVLVQTLQKRSLEWFSE